jgi:hypothetical protein
VLPAAAQRCGAALSNTDHVDTDLHTRGLRRGFTGCDTSC